jgi:predicted transcriptional regulator
MYEVEIYTTLPTVEGEIHMMSQFDIDTYEKAVEAAARVEKLGFRAVIVQVDFG